MSRAKAASDLCFTYRRNRVWSGGSSVSGRVFTSIVVSGIKYREIMALSPFPILLNVVFHE